MTKFIGTSEVTDNEFGLVEEEAADGVVGVPSRCQPAGSMLAIRLGRAHVP